MEIITFRVVGSQPLLMNNPQTVDPTAPVTKAIKALTGKKKKTDADIEDIMRLKFAAALYIDKAPIDPENREADQRGEADRIWSVRSLFMAVESRPGSCPQDQAGQGLGTGWHHLRAPQDVHPVQWTEDHGRALCRP